MEMKVYMAFYSFDCESHDPIGIYETEEEAIEAADKFTEGTCVYELELGQNLYCENWDEWKVWGWK